MRRMNVSTSCGKKCEISYDDDDDGKKKSRVTDKMWFANHIEVTVNWIINQEKNFFLNGLIQPNV